MENKLMKKLIALCFIASFQGEIHPSFSSPATLDTKVKIVNPRKQALILGELHRAFERSSNALIQFRRQSQLNKERSPRSRTVPRYTDVQKHLATYTQLKNIYDNYIKNQELVLSLELLRSVVQNEEALRLLVLENQEEEMQQLETNPLTI
jgi:hypothetical protein